MRSNLATLLVLLTACEPKPADPAPAPTASPALPPVASAPAASPCSGPSPGPDYVCAQNCGPPVARLDDPPVGYHWATSSQAAHPICPKCLPGTVRIATPLGEVPVSELHVGDVIWTTDLSGRRVPRPVRLVGHMEAPTKYRIVRLTLADDRVVRASAGHPLADGRHAGDIVVGDVVDGARVVAASQTPLEGDSTYDVRPAGDTGQYWADGVLLGSTLE